MKDLSRLDDIIDELQTGHEALKDTQNNAVIFGSARTLEDHEDYIFARTLGRVLSLLGYNVLTGGGPGIMEAANRGAYGDGPCAKQSNITLGKSIGLNLELPFENTHNSYQDIALNHHSFFTRKYMFFRDTDVYFIMPGGDGTMDELYEARTLMLTGKIKKAPIVLCGSEFWGPLKEWMYNTQVLHGVISEDSMDNLMLVDTVPEALSMAGIKEKVKTV